MRLNNLTVASLSNNLTVASLSKAKFNICLVKIKLAASETGIGHAYNIRKNCKTENDIS